MAFSLLLPGALSASPVAEASFFSFLGSSASAQDTDNKNSQTMGLLQANVSSVIIINETGTKKNEAFDSGVEVSIISNNALMPAVSPMGASADVGGDLAFDEVSVYVVRSGDSLSQVAEMFGVSVDTILSANDLQKGVKLKEGDILLILPFSGVEHTVAKGETLQGIANKYKIDIEDILFYNEIESGSKLAIGAKLLIPGGSIQSGSAKPSSGSIAKGGSSLPAIIGYFANPVPGARRSRGITGSHRGVDLAAPTGTSIKASASGKVKFARTGYNGGFGNLVIISHPNGTETLYAHQSRIAVGVGEQVTQGQTIGYIGSTGRSTGPHLHFEVKGAKNPF